MAAPYYAIIRKVEVTIPGDELSRTNPGHGYPEETREYTEIDRYALISELGPAIDELLTNGVPFELAMITPLNIKVNRIVTVTNNKGEIVL